MARVKTLANHEPRRVLSSLQRPLRAQDDAPAEASSTKTRNREDERDFFLNVLGASTTKRDANSYLKRFNVDKAKDVASTTVKQIDSAFSSYLALVKLRAIQSIDDKTLAGICRTLSQVSRLGLQPVVVLDGDSDETTWELTPSQQRKLLTEQADRMCALFEEKTPSDACRLDNALGVVPNSQKSTGSSQGRDNVQVPWKNLILSPLKRGMIPVIPPLGFTLEDQRVVTIDADDAMVAIVKAFAGVNQSAKENFPSKTEEVLIPYAVDRVILLDPLGGIPSLTRPDKAHIFINMEQEHNDIKSELRSPIPQPSNEGTPPPLTEVQRKQHMKNLDLLHNTLSLLPATSSALITSPLEAATLNGSAKSAAPAEMGVRTRRPRNPLIFNLLTDKPLISSSLPAARMNPTTSNGALQVLQACPATFVKKGMPVSMIPNPRTDAWRPPMSDDPPLTLQDPRIDQDRLWALIEDSFNRKLDQHHYTHRIQNKLAGVIVAGDYEGGAILTWELPPGVPDDGTDAARRRMVPYLDKLAVRKRSQGAGGVADVIFSAMVRTCFPHGVCWRSRKNNPVNKWYFERSAGSYRIPNTQWTMFWTDRGLEEKRRQWLDYEAVCRTVQPSWADDKPAD